MEYQVVWLEPALLDLNDQIEFRSEHTTTDEALEFADMVIEYSKGLGKLPHRGRILASLGKGYRELIYERIFRIVYQVQPATVEILAFIHTSRDFPSAWRSRRRRS